MNTRSDSNSPIPSNQAREDVQAWLETHGDEVYAYAVGRVESESVADDLVQETFLAALKNHDRFEGRASPKTWLIAILRNKIIEHYRRRSRRRQQQESIDDTTGSTFDEHGIWKIPVGGWPKRPEEHFQDAEFWQTFHKCLAKMPAAMADVFTLRVLDGLEVENICNTLKITSTNMAVRLHRARMMLRNCLGKNWFGDE